MNKLLKCKEGLFQCQTNFNKKLKQILIVKNRNKLFSNIMKGKSERSHKNFKYKEKHQQKKICKI